MIGGGEKAFPNDHDTQQKPKPVVPSKANEDRAARAVVFDSDLSRQINIVERLIGWLKEFRRIFARFEKSAKNFGGMIRLGFIQRYMRKILPDEV